MDKVKELFDWYLKNQSKLVEKFNGKYLVIADDKVVGSFDDENQAYFDGRDKYGLGNFIIQLCTPGMDAYLIHLYSPLYGITNENGATTFSFRCPSVKEIDFNITG